MKARPQVLSPAARFGRAVMAYETHAGVQKHTAIRLAERIASLPLPPQPRVLEIGCGTGLLTRELANRLGPANWCITDLAPAMLTAVRRRVTLLGTVRYLQLDGEYPALASRPGFDLICSSLTAQWFSDLNAALARLSALLAPGGYLALATLTEQTFEEWRQAHTHLGLTAATPGYPAATAIGSGLFSMQGGVQTELLVQRYPDGLSFLRNLKGLGATAPAPGTRPLSVPALRRVLRRFNEQGASVTYHLAYGVWRKSTRPSDCVFVTGTDTGVGKTLLCAVLARAWNADYWKPLQTGVAEEPSDTETVARLAQLPEHRLHPSAYLLQAPLSPWAAAPLENMTIDATTLALPNTTAPLIVEGAGGLYVPLDDHHMMIDLIAKLGVPVILTARSTLGTLNHTLLSLQALRERAIPVAGVVMNGPLSASNRAAIERFGKVRVLAEIPALASVDAHAVTRLAQAFPSLEECLVQR
jgi:malonyl-CoA O-methyltransferase